MINKQKVFKLENRLRNKFIFIDHSRKYYTVYPVTPDKNSKLFLFYLKNNNFLINKFDNIQIWEKLLTMECKIIKL